MWQQRWQRSAKHHLLYHHQIHMQQLDWSGWVMSPAALLTGYIQSCGGWFKWFLSQSWTRFVSAVAWIFASEAKPKRLVAKLNDLSYDLQFSTTFEPTIMDSNLLKVAVQSFNWLAGKFEPLNIMSQLSSFWTIGGDHFIQLGVLKLFGLFVAWWMQKYVEGRCSCWCNAVTYGAYFCQCPTQWKPWYPCKQWIDAVFGLWDFAGLGLSMRNNTLFIFNLYINLESLPIEWVTDFFVEDGNVCVFGSNGIPSFFTKIIESLCLKFAIQG